MTRTSRMLIVLFACCLLAGSAFAQGVEDLPGFDPDRYIVKLSDKVPLKMDRAKFVKAAGAGEVYHDLRSINAVAAHLPAVALKALRNNPNVEYIERDLPRYPMAQSTPYGITSVQADQVSAGPGNRLVCVIDSGYDLGHEDLGNNVSGFNGNLAWDSDGFGHGTHVAGTIAALDNTTGVIGVFPGVDLFIVRVFGDDGAWAFSSSLIVAAEECGNAGSNVISMSLGCSGRRCSSNSERAAFDSLWAQGLISVAAAGNDGNTQMSYPASYDSVISVGALDEALAIADFSQQNSQVELSAPGVLVQSTLPTGLGTESVAEVGGTGYSAIALDGSPAASGTGALHDCGFGNPGECGNASGKVCLVSRGDISFAEKEQECANAGGVGAILYNNAPGNFSGTLNGAGTVPVVAVSDTDGATMLGQLGQSATVTTGPGNYAFWDGTSMATPHVAGVAALLWSHDTSWTNQEIRDCMNDTALDLGSAGRDNAYGFGNVQAADALAGLLAGSCGDGGTDPPTCSPAGSSCTDNADCCSNSCKGKSGAKTCK